MLTNVSKKIEMTANVAIIIVSCLLATALIRNYVLTRSISNQKTPIPQSETRNELSVSSLDLDWTQDKQILILALSSSCHYCSASAPFYKRLAEAGNDTRLIAVVPQSVQEGQDYLRRLGVPIKDVQHADFSAIGIQGTPTLLLVDSTGAIRSTWIGQLSPEREADVLKAMSHDQTN